MGRVSDTLVLLRISLRRLLCSSSMKSSGEQLDERIVEVHWDPQREHWRMMRFRDDKPNGNFKTVVENIIQSIADGVEKDAVCIYPTIDLLQIHLPILTVVVTFELYQKCLESQTGSESGYFAAWSPSFEPAAPSTVICAAAAAITCKTSAYTVSSLTGASRYAVWSPRAIPMEQSGRSTNDCWNVEMTDRLFF